MAEHGYGRYSTGCRCEICRAAKAGYMRGQRAAARADLMVKRWRDEPPVVAGITHGYAGFQNVYCRCEVCREAKSDSDRARARCRRGAR